ncbi:MAG: hypothetical protein JO342_07570 [Solirubrobacterales bacterium]|nr:hypothetical protein [Solirubrobacterales bacterium]
MAADELTRAMHRFALESLRGGASASSELPTGVRALDLWSDGDYGSVLFWIDRDHDPWDWGQATLEHVDAKRSKRGSWRITGGGGAGSDEPAEILAGCSSGLHKLAGGSDGSLRLTVGIATPDVAVIRLRDGHKARERPPGADGFFLLGITVGDPLTFAYAVDATGAEIPAEPLLL